MVGHLVCMNCSGLIVAPNDPEIPMPPALVASGGICGPTCTCGDTDGVR